MRKTITLRCGHTLTHDFAPTAWTVQTYGNGDPAWALARETAAITAATLSDCRGCIERGQIAEVLTTGEEMISEADLIAQEARKPYLCPVCGQRTGELMTTSRGTMCPDCYISPARAD